MHPRYIEASLRKVVRALEVASINDRKRKVKAVRHLSERLLHSRLKMLKARVSFIDQEDRVNQLKNKKKDLIEQGVDGILKEFNVFDNTYE